MYRSTAFLLLILLTSLNSALAKYADDAEDDDAYYSDDEDPELKTAEDDVYAYDDEYDKQSDEGYLADDDVKEGYDDHDHHGYGYKPKKKKVYVPVFVPEKEKKKMKILSVDKGFHVHGGTQLFGKFKSLKHCMKACAITPSCLSGDYNPWLHKCYQHTNFTACDNAKAHPQFVHFSKVPCNVIDAPTGTVTLGVNMANGIEQKGIDTLQQCIKKCAAAGLGIPATATTPQSFDTQACFAIDYDFATHRCYFFGTNILLDSAGNPVFLHCHTAAGVPQTSSLGTRPNPTVVHITLCPLPTG